ncbi:leucine-rich repeat extensin-like protein 5 [Tripterygium wilfordii]|uniref:Leucine-rich repeat extensin-like protein 5 n=1 Tax=Tripterygium wilfordii TaxID=458696 RepID=A0A7J7E0Z9_TRIWF|nr:non-specific lipid transfer protein GPI-anchored 11-like [Tripterygium wilfordii]KAF5752257.1 leucine-rich repeat extensin-like protein 5 [Tripterygium wilfordii]
MEYSLVPLPRLVPILTVALVVLMVPVNSQINTPCSPSVISTFTPCMNFVTNSTANGTSPTADCCNALRSLTSSGMDCLCLIVTGSVPFQIPINRTLAISLPRVCNMPGVPVQCKASGSPIPAPGPIALGPNLSPRASTSPSPTASAVPEPTSSASPPESDTTPLLTPPSPTADAGTPTTTTGTGGSPTSAAFLSYRTSPAVLLLALGFAVLNFF